MQKYLCTAPRVLYLEKLSLAICGVFTYLQATSPNYGPRLKRAGDVLARMVPGAAFAKAWRPKPAASVLTKLYHRRGQTTRGWLTDALQGRITCDSQESVNGVAEFFNNVLSQQGQAAYDDDRSILSAPPSGAEVMSYNLSGLKDDETEKAVDELASYCEAAMTPEGMYSGASRVFICKVLLLLFSGSDSCRVQHRVERKCHIPAASECCNTVQS